MKKKTQRRGRRFAMAAAAASCGTAIVLGPAAGGAAAAECGVTAMVNPFVDHVNSAHLETSPFQQARDLMDVDAYVLAHTVLVESMLAPVLPTVAGTEDPAVSHIDSAHLETSPFQQARDLLDVDDYVLAHTVLVESMLAPAVSGTGCPGEEAAAAPAAPAAPAPATAPAAPAPAAPAHGGHSMSADVTMNDLAFSPADVTVPAGSTVTWTNKEDAPHTVTSKGGGALKSKNLQKGDTYSHMFMTAGTYSYYCTVHPNMMGKVTVQ
jgi:amicyanin